MLERRRDLAGNEIRTRNALIDPILGALDWNVSNPSQVTTEYELPSGRVDYALLGKNGKAAAIIEAKRLGEDLGAKPRSQLVRYAYESRPSYAVLTDGDVWEIYSVEASEGEFHLREAVRCILSESDPLQSARELLVLWQANMESGQPAEVETPTGGLPSNEGDSNLPNNTGGGGTNADSKSEDTDVPGPDEPQPSRGSGQIEQWRLKYTLKLLDHGLTRKQIASAMGISPYYTYYLTKKARERREAGEL